MVKLLKSVVTSHQKELTINGSRLSYVPSMRSRGFYIVSDPMVHTGKRRSRAQLQIFDTNVGKHQRLISRRSFESLRSFDLWIIRHANKKIARFEPEQAPQHCTLTRTRLWHKVDLPLSCTPYAPRRIRTGVVHHPISVHLQYKVHFVGMYVPIGGTSSYGDHLAPPTS